MQLKATALQEFYYFALARLDLPRGANQVFRIDRVPVAAIGIAKACDIERLDCIIYLVKICGVNLAGVQIVVRLSLQHPEIEDRLKNKKFNPQDFL